MWARSRSFIEKWKMMLLNAVIKKYLSLSGIVHMAFFFCFCVSCLQGNAFLYSSNQLVGFRFALSNLKSN